MADYIPPDYDGDDDIDEDFSTDDEGIEETKLDNELKESMTTPPFSTPWRTGAGTQQQTPTYPWQQNTHQNPQTNIWGTPGTSSWKPSTTPAWGSGTSTQNREQINRNKKVIFIDFLDCIAETFSSNQVPGFLPRDIYDLTPRFDVWQKLAAIHPEKVYILIPRNLLPTTNGAQGWEAALTYYCCSLSSFLRVPFTNCQVLVQSVIGQPKEEIMLSVIDDPKRPIDRASILSIGIYSGMSGQADIDKKAAEVCRVDYVDLYNLLQMI